MKYTYKERVRLARKLKVFLAIFFAAGIFFTGKVILDKTFADEQNYGTATVTFNSGADGKFEDGTTTNTVTYNLTKQATKYSHTSNVTDEGRQLFDYSSGQETNDVVIIYMEPMALIVILVFGKEIIQTIQQQTIIHHLFREN